MRLTTVGCAGSFPSPTSPASCYLVEAEDAAGRTWRVLLDLGSGALGPLQRYLDVADIDAVLLSHLHPDHFVDLCGLYVALRYDPRARAPREVAVHGPEATMHRIVAAYGADEHDGLEEVYRLHPWVHGQAREIGPFTVSAYRVNHTVEAYGIRLQHHTPAGPAVLAYTGDTDDCPALTDLAADAGLLLAEASFEEGRDVVRGVHLTGLRAGQVAQRAGVERLVLTHVPAWTAPEVVLAEARTAFSGPVHLAQAGDTTHV